MARGKSGSGVPPVDSSSSSRPRRSSRNNADGKQNVLPVAATTGNQIKLGAAAKQLAVSVEATATTLYPIELRTYVAPAAGRTEEAKLVEKFYCAVNFNLLGLHRFYANDAELLWNFNGRQVNLKMAKEVKNYMYGASSRRKFHASHFHMLPIPQKNSLSLTVHGITKLAGNELGTFVHSFVLDLPGYLILTDSLVVTDNAPKGSSPKKPQDDDSNNQCGLCKEMWNSADTQEWVCCDCCDMWIHVKCDPTCIRDMKRLKSSKYHCPKCKPKLEDALTVKGSSKEKSVEPIIVSCSGMEGIYKPEQQKIECSCFKCPPNMLMTLNQWANHTGCRKRNWKKSIYIKGTQTLLAGFVVDCLGGIGKISLATEVNETSSAEASQHPAAEASQHPAAEASQHPAAASCSSYAMSEKEHPQKPKICILYDYDSMKSHQDKEDDHDYETAARISATLSSLKEDGVLERVAREAFDSADPEIVLGVHDLEQLQHVDSLPVTDKEHDTKYSLFSSEGTPKAVYSATGAAIRGVDLVLEGYYEQAFALIRPPGHHAGGHKSEGFCYFNNIAIAGKHAIDHHDKERILIVDFDVHHGNGTQDIFYDNKQVLFFSTHGEHLNYPESKKNFTHIGVGNGEGYNVNVPLREGYNNADLFYVFDQVFLPVATEFKPDIVLVSAGYDAGVDEKIGGCEISARGFGTVVHKLLSLAQGKMVLALEGGYNVARLPICISHTIRAMLGDEDAFFQRHDYRDERVHSTTISTVNQLKEILRFHWDVFKNDSTGPSPEGQASRPGEGGGADGGAP